MKLSQHDGKIDDWDVNYQHKQKRKVEYVTCFSFSYMTSVPQMSVPVQLAIIPRDRYLPVALRVVLLECLMYRQVHVACYMVLFQIYDFSAPNESPCAISYHPSRQIFACGFESGVIRVN